MPLFNKRSSMLEVQNRALIKTAKERAEQIEKLERELQTLRERAEQADKIVRELQSLREEIAKPTKSNATCSKHDPTLSASRWSAIFIPRRHQR